MNRKPITHGKASSYTNRKCRCEECREAHRVACREARERRAQRTPPPEAHGNPFTYGNWKCRCEACRKAWAAYCLDRYHHRKGQEAT